MIPPVVAIPEPLATNITSFTGRTWLLESVLKWLTETATRMFLLTGDPGTGKSMTAAWLAGAGPLPDEEEARARLKQIRTRVGAAYFCSVAAGNLGPRTASEQIAGQLTRHVMGFGAALAATLTDRISLVSTLTVGEAQTGASVTGINIGRIDLGSLGDEASFDRALRAPLQKLYEVGYADPLLLIVDGLDEALVYEGTTLVQLVARLGGLPPSVRVLATTRPDDRVLSLFPDAQRKDLLDDAPPGTDDVRAYALERLAILQDDPRRLALADTISTAAEGHFLYAHLVLNDLIAHLPAIPDLRSAQLPSGLPGLYREFLNRELADPRMRRWFTTFQPVLGLIAVAQGGGLMRSQIEPIADQRVYEALVTCKQYLDGSLPDGPFRLFHRSFSEFLLEDPTSGIFHIDAADSHRQIVDYYWPPEASGRPWLAWDAYGMSFIPAHLAGASRSARAGEQHRQTERLVWLVLSPGFRATRLAQVRDEAQPRRDLAQAVAVAAVDLDPTAPPLLVEAALGLQRLRMEQLQPETIFERARAGDVAGAERRLALFDAEADWRQAARLTLAWLASEHNKEAARSVCDRVAPSVVDPDLRLLLQRVDVDLLDAPMPSLRVLGPPPPHIVVSILDRLGGSNNVQGLEPIAFEGESVSAGTDAAEAYIAAQDSPLLVAFAAGPPENTRYLRQYLALHAANNYIYYRNRSLWAILRSVLHHPDQVWVRSILEELCAAALAGSRIEFRHALPLTIRALLARAGGADAGQALDAYRLRLLTGTGLVPLGRESDAWGHSMRRMASLAEAYALLLGQPAAAGELLARALALPYGFAGFRAPACTALAGAIRVCRQPAAATMSAQALDMALTAAHNIQDYALCARNTGRVNAMLRRRWSVSGESIAQIVERFCREPGHSDFAAFHRVGETYHRRDQGPHKLAIPGWVREALTLGALANLYSCSPAEILNLNQPWQLEQSLPRDTEVGIPDREWTALMAMELAAEVLAANEVAPPDRRALLQRLVPLAAADDTALDTLLARLLIASSPTDPAVLDRLSSLVSLKDPADPVTKFNPREIAAGTSALIVQPPDGIAT